MDSRGCLFKRRSAHLFPEDRPFPWKYLWLGLVAAAVAISAGLILWCKRRQTLTPA